MAMSPKQERGDVDEDGDTSGHVIIVYTLLTLYLARTCSTVGVLPL